MKKILIILAGFFLLNASLAQAQELEYFEAKVEQITNEKSILHPGEVEPQIVQEMELVVTSGASKGAKIQVENGNIPVANIQRYQPGDNLVLYQESIDGTYNIADYVRRPGLIILSVIFVIAAVIVGRWQGLTSLIGLGLSFLVIFLYILPKIAAGSNPILIVILGSLVIIPVIFLLSHGIGKKTWVAMAGTLIAMLITGALIVIFVNYTKLTGFSSEEAGFIQAMFPGLINMKNLLIAGMLIATLGLLDDITISQAAIVEELKKANPKLTFGKLYRQAMKVGRDHIASMINTLILVYAGASFPLLLLFINSQQSIGMTLNFEIVADEIVRTLTGSIGLILAVPITTALAAGVNMMMADEPGEKVIIDSETKSKSKELPKTIPKLKTKV